MKLNRIITLCAVAAALAFTVGSAFAQQDNGNGNTNGGGRRNRQGGGGGGGGFGGDPAQFQQQMMDRIRDRLSFTNDTDWAAVQPMVQKVLDARRDVPTPNMRALFRNRNGDNNGGGNGGNGGGNGGGRGGFGAPPSPEQDALQSAIDSDAPAAQIKDLLAKYKAAQKSKQAKLDAAQADLKKVLTSKQEAEAYVLGLVN